MQIERLISMANQIGDFFESYPNPEQAKEGIAQHIKRFWAKNMREQIIAYVKQQQGQGLHLMVGEAIREHEAYLQ